MMQPETKYARSGEIRVAYQVTGEGPVDLVWAPGTASHLDLDWDFPAKARFIRSLSSFCRLVRFDKRGTGLSDRPRSVSTLEERTDDIRAVMDAVGSERAALFGVSEGASMACLFAATYPQRVHSLIVWGGQARWVQAEDYPWGLSPKAHAQMIADLRENGVTLEYLTGSGAGLGRRVDPAFLDWFLRYCRSAASPSAAAALEEMNGQIDIRNILPTIRVPTLVMNRTEDPGAHIEAARALAACIPGAKFAEFPGATHSMFSIEPERVLAEIEEFVTGTRAVAMADRFLASVLFLDIVGSTERAAQLGDADWRDLLERYRAVVRRHLAEFDGTEVDMAGDGLFARFDGPTRAIRCACAISRAVRSMGIEVRAGVHTGEVERMGDQVRGIAVHIGARVMERAGPGEVVASRTVKDLVAGAGIRFADRGPHALKGISEEWQLFVVVQNDME
ncbi:MAG TPA: adenylate/guanylate cyclase domain-containing protein [bacterium]|nr:adenylate/guanylate cyclase domain-containing protein [bacterium]